MKLGIYFIDLFANAMLLFVVLTFLAFTAMAENPEERLPPVELPRAEQAGSGMTALSRVVVSAQRDGRGSARYFLNADEVAWEDLGRRVAALAHVAIELRVDEELPTRTAVQLMALLRRLNIHHVTFAYKAS